MTSSGDEGVAAKAFRRGAADYVVKSALMTDAELVRRSINESLRRFRLEQTNRDLARKLKRANGDLEHKNARLADLTDTAHRFVDDVAHEFRTPLAVIKEFASILADGLGGEVTEKQTEFLDFIVDATRDLATLIDDFLDSSKLRAQTLRIDRQAHNIHDLVDSVWPMLESRANVRRVTIERAVSADLPEIYADADKVRRTLINLVVNAIKFSPQGSNVRVSAETLGQHAVGISVADQGAGMSAEVLEALFERFEQALGGAPSDTKGFGLGLSIVRDLVAINLGSMNIDSTPGEGSTFAFTLPINNASSVIESVAALTKLRDPAAHLSVLKITSTQPPQDIHALISRVAAMCYSTDVLRPAPDGRSLIAIGDTRTPDAWRDRLLAADRVARARPGGQDHADLIIDTLGSWNVNAAQTALLELTRSQTAGPLPKRHAA